MVKDILIFLLLFFFTGILGHTAVAQDMEKRTKSTSYPNSNQLDGLEEIFNEEGNLISSIDWKMGIKDGKEIQYYDSGGERMIIPYKAGEKEGLEKSYYR